jgi:hypothetical protein
MIHVTFIFIHFVIICDVLLWRMRRIWLYPLNLGVTEVVLEEMLNVGRNLDRTGQNPYLLTFTLILSILFLIMFHLLLFYSDYSYLYFSRKQEGFHTLESYNYKLPEEIGDLRQKYFHI